METTVPYSGLKRRIIEQFEYIEEKDEYHISAIIDIPIKVREISILEGKISIQEREEYIAQNVYSIINLKRAQLIVFTSNQKSVSRFKKYLKEVSLKHFFPIQIEIDRASMSNIINKFQSVSHLKFLKKKQVVNIKSLKINGLNILADKLVMDMLSDTNFYISEIGGLLNLSSKLAFYAYINNHGRIRLRGKVSELKPNDLLSFTDNFFKV